MKKILFYIAVLLLIACSSTRDISNHNVNRENASQFNIRKIKRIKNIYVIYATRNDSIFKILAGGENTESIDYHREKIRTGKYYSIDIEKLYPHDSIGGESAMLKLWIATSSGIKLEEKSHYSLYFAKNLNGLYIENKSVK